MKITKRMQSVFYFLKILTISLSVPVIDVEQRAPGHAVSEEHETIQLTESAPDLSLPIQCITATCTT